MRTLARLFAALALAATLGATLGATAAEAGRAGSRRVGGYGPNGKGSHYVGGHRTTPVGRFLARHL